MKITHNKVGQNLNLRDTNKSEKAADASPIAANDIKTKTSDAAAVSEASKVNLSSRAQEIKRAKEVAMATPDVNQEKVARLQKLIDDGKYKTDAKEIASKMVDEQLSWE